MSQKAPDQIGTYAVLLLMEGTDPAGQEVHLLPTSTTRRPWDAIASDVQTRTEADTSSLIPG